MNAPDVNASMSVIELAKLSAIFVFFEIFEMRFASEIIDIPKNIKFIKLYIKSLVLYFTNNDDAPIVIKTATNRIENIPSMMFNVNFFGVIEEISCLFFKSSLYIRERIFPESIIINSEI